MTTEEIPAPEVDPETGAAYEVGWFREGCIRDDLGQLFDQRHALQQLLDAYGDRREAWILPPEIREVHNHEANVGLLDFGKTYVVNRQPCVWAVYGRLREKPEHGHVPEGVRLPKKED